MKTSLIVIAAGLGLVLSGTIFGVEQPEGSTKQADMEKCFRMHKQLMSKPAVTNVEACWRAHAYLMGRVTKTP